MGTETKPYHHYTRVLTIFAYDSYIYIQVVLSVYFFFFVRLVSCDERKNNSNITNIIMRSFSYVFMRSWSKRSATLCAF